MLKSGISNFRLVSPNGVEIADFRDDGTFTFPNCNVTSLFSYSPTSVTHNFGWECGGTTGDWVVTFTRLSDKVVQAYMPGFSTGGIAGGDDIIQQQTKLPADKQHLMPVSSMFFFNVCQYQHIARGGPIGNMIIQQQPVQIYFYDGDEIEIYMPCLDLTTAAERSSSNTQSFIAGESFTFRPLVVTYTTS
ncbi:hypothetical protein KJ807_05490 [Patescibacteria group bacterium]|nr:hypothetical protein [Patescibacteria group bacterium]